MKKSVDRRAEFLATLEKLRQEIRQMPPDEQRDAMREIFSRVRDEVYGEGAFKGS